MSQCASAFSILGFGFHNIQSNRTRCSRFDMNVVPSDTNKASTRVPNYSNVRLRALQFHLMGGVTYLGFMKVVSFGVAVLQPSEL